MEELPDRVRRRLDEVFGEVLPDVTTDERDDMDTHGDARTSRDADLLADRPPHHDRQSP